MDNLKLPVQDTMSKTDNMSPPHVEQEIASYDPAERARNQEKVGDVVSPFSKTPLEIRNQIYEYLLSTKYCKVDFQDAEPVSDEMISQLDPTYIELINGFVQKYLDERRYDDCKGVYQFHPGILTVNRQINHEASQMLRKNFLVRLTLDAELDTKFLPVVAKEELARRVTYPAIEVSIIDTELSHLNADPLYLMFAGDDMATFCRILLRDSRFPSSLLIAITVLKQTKSVSKLLEPFRRIHGMASVRITGGAIEDDYRADLIKNMLEQAPDGDTALQEIQTATEKGDQAASIHEYSTAVSRFRKAFDDTDDYWTIYDTAEVILESGEFKGQNLDISFAQTLLTLIGKLTMMTLKLKDYNQVFGWLGMVWPHFGRYSLYFGVPGSERWESVARAVEDLREAVLQDPGCPEFLANLVR